MWVIIKKIIFLDSIIKKKPKKGVSNSIGNKYFLFKERLKLPQQYIATKIFILFFYGN